MSSRKCRFLREAEMDRAIFIVLVCEWNESRNMVSRRRKQKIRESESLDTWAAIKILFQQKASELD